HGRQVGDHPAEKAPPDFSGLTLRRYNGRRREDASAFEQPKGAARSSRIWSGRTDKRELDG
ncbi:hypothetical protein, partial [Mesorhizobium sp. M0859]|uniref:hypothetical protein n=1 Tax=Mesorhizobium sp. M0859 TaxID=2957014 RepID=UPI003338B55C